MQRKKVICFALAMLMTATSFVGCGNNNLDVEENPEMDVDVKASDLKDDKKYAALSFEEIASRRDTETAESVVYKYVSDAVTVDTSELIDISGLEAENSKVKSLIKDVNEALRSGVSINNVSDEILNYMLLKFDATPFTWTCSDIAVRGMDAQTRMYFVDVTYKTTNEYKNLFPDSIIVRGSEVEDTWKQKRYTDYITWLESGESCYDAEGKPTKWLEMCMEEWSLADAMNTVVYGESIEDDSVVMDGYEEDIDKEKEDNDEAPSYADTFRDEEGYINYTFEDRWGSIDELRKAQDGITLMQRVLTSNKESVFPPENIGICTYTGLTEVASKFGATMTFRFLLKPSYNIGLNEKLKVQSVYLYSYDLDEKNSDDKSIIDIYKTETIPNGSVLQPYFEGVIKSYSKAVEETNHVGLEQLFEAYQKYDSYFEDIYKYAYISNGGFSVEPIGRKGNEVACIVTQQMKERAKGTNMTMPSYLNKSLVKFKLCDDDKIRIVSIVNMSTKLTGEPLSMIRECTGVSDKISYSESKFTTANQVAVENAIADFEYAMLSANGKWDQSIYNVVDMGISSTEKSNMTKYFESVADIKANRSIVWLTGYESKSNIYAKVKLREVFVGEQNYEAESTLSLVYRNNAWKVVAYIRNIAVPIENGDITDKNCFLKLDLTKATKEEQVQMFSQVKEVSGSLGGLEEVDNTTDTAPAWEDEAYTGTTVLTDEEGNVIETEVSEVVSETVTEPEGNSDNILDLFN